MNRLNMITQVEKCTLKCKFIYYCQNLS